MCGDRFILVGWSGVIEFGRVVIVCFWFWVVYFVFFVDGLLFYKLIVGKILLLWILEGFLSFCCKGSFRYWFKEFVFGIRYMNFGFMIYLLGDFR